MFEDNYEEENSNAEFQYQLAAFDEMYANDDYKYLDSDDLEFILDHLFMSNQLKKAEWAIQKALDHFPQNSELTLRLAQILTIKGESNKSLKLLLQLERVEPYNADVVVGIALCYRQMKNSTFAIKYFKKALELTGSEDKEDIIIDLAVELEQNKEYKAAITLLKEAIQNGENSEAIVYELAHCYEKLDDYENATKCFLDYIDEDPYSLMTWYNLGNTYYKFEKTKEAIWAYEYTIIIDEDFIPAYYSLANAYFQDKMTSKALECYKKCLEVDDKDPIVFCSIGECLEEEGAFEEAYKYYCMSTDLMPQLGDAWIGRGVVSDILNFHTRAIHEILIALQNDEYNADYWKALGNAYENDMQEEKAIEAYEKAYSLNSTDEDIIIDYLTMWIQLSDTPVLDFIKSDHKLQQAPITRIILCFSYWENGDRTESMMLFNEILEENINLAKKLFFYFPEMEKDSYFIDLMKEYEEDSK